MTKETFKIIVVGAGPAGLLLSLLLSRQGIPVTVLEAKNQLDNQPRATHYGPPAVYELRRAGILPEILEEGFLPAQVCWRKLDGTYLTGIDNDILGDHPDRLACLPLNRLGQILLTNLQKQPSAEIKWGHRVIGLGQNDQRAWLDVSTSAGEQRMEATYIVGCDGAKSQIRRSLHGDLNFPGKTWDEQVVATNVYFDFHKFGYHDSNFIMHPEHWHMAARITTDGLWRVSYGEKAGLTNEQLADRQTMKFQAMLPGHPTPDQYRITNFSPYRVHQRLAESMRVGRFLLAADAAHLCNPFGGLGLTSGIVDVGGLYDCLYGISSGRAADDILDVYDKVRREKYQSIVDPISSANFIRMFQTDVDAVLESGSDEFFNECLKAKTNSVLAREVALGINCLQYDFTKHYIVGE
ncbi:hypothetical protein PENSTE_c038G04868 [Penicillium steckii]|uniref:FAD-binding domain-containing protein n=1 Tax=Penicillium steckii TaxID=303698 RepID=A0A1V6SJ91_9EURO|nr:hypothetical protein PENSTE_c038G04868 [Penicillium steckii]